MAQRKCSNCGLWNTDVDYCTNCNTVLNLKLKAQQERIEKIKTEPKPKPDQLDKIYDWFQYHPFLLVRVIFNIFRSVWVALMAVLTFFIYSIAWAAG